MKRNGYMTNAFAAWRMMGEAQAVIAYRTLGAAGLWPVAQSEMWRMTLEKGPAFTAASQAAWTAALTGAAPDRVAAAWLRPISSRTRSNERRLSRRR